MTAEQQEQIQLEQGIMMSRFKESREYSLIKNTFEALRIMARLDRMRAMKAQGTRENCLYFTGIEDGIQNCLDEIDKIVGTADMIREKNELLAQYKEAS